jgi:AcrR family transcriptional regulator
MSEVKPGRRAAYAAQTREAIIEAARELFASDGFDASSIDAIAARAEVSKGAVYHHFADKQELFAALCRETQYRVLNEVVAAASHAGADLWQRVEAAAGAFVDSYVADDEARALLYQAGTVLGQARAHQLEEEITLPFLRYTLSELATTGQLQETPIDATVEMLGGLLHSGANYVAGADDPADAAASVREVMMLMLSGLRASS